MCPIEIDQSIELFILLLVLFVIYQISRYVANTNEFAHRYLKTLSNSENATIIWSVVKWCKYNYIILQFEDPIEVIISSLHLINFTWPNPVSRDIFSAAIVGKVSLLSYVSDKSQII